MPILLLHYLQIGLRGENVILETSFQLNDVIHNE